MDATWSSDGDDSEVGKVVTDVKPDWVLLPLWISNEVTAAGAVAASSEDRMNVDTMVFVFILGLGGGDWGWGLKYFWNVKVLNR